MEELVNALITLLIGGIIGGLITAYFDLRKQIISDVWLKRFEQYKKLWAISGNFPEWPRDNKVTYAKVFDISTELKNWYFNNGGILLSTKSRKMYGQAQQLLTKKADKDSTEVISPEDYDSIKDAFSTLRSQMTKDLSSRSRKLIS